MRLRSIKLVIHLHVFFAVSAAFRLQHRPALLSGEPLHRPPRDRKPHLPHFLLFLSVAPQRTITPHRSDIRHTPTRRRDQSSHLSSRELTRILLRHHLHLQRLTFQSPLPLHLFLYPRHPLGRDLR
ncbi:hypothetical protein IEQ34_003770 [Dendrobium chrysotoxum]|uniref:Secreted protein n=1 Tax=Dendrobium chrysotoxum TaxID=161865 RepID=A0AAV7HFB8_DENCH|nr:hypothetical protein IEQ34_003770 [Dendrobium chrysotoxum]